MGRRPISPRGVRRPLRASRVQAPGSSPIPFCSVASGTRQPRAAPIRSKAACLHVQSGSKQERSGHHRSPAEPLPAVDHDPLTLCEGVLQVLARSTVAFGENGHARSGKRFSGRSSFNGACPRSRSSSLPRRGIALPPHTTGDSLFATHSDLLANLFPLSWISARRAGVRVLGSLPSGNTSAGSGLNAPRRPCLTGVPGAPRARAAALDICCTRFEFSPSTESFQLDRSARRSGQAPPRARSAAGACSW